MTSNKSAGALRTIGEVAEEIDVATHVLRFWESKFHQIKPQKRRGRRYYRPEDVDVITKIKTLLYEQGYTIRGVQKYLITESKKKSESSEDNGSSSATESNSSATATVRSNQSTTVQQPNIFAPKPQAPVASFKTDMFGNIIPANGGPLSSSNVVPSSSVEKKEGYNQEDLVKLKSIYSGLREARDRLKKIA